jgi:hypothetical protein
MASAPPEPPRGPRHPRALEPEEPLLLWDQLVQARDALAQQRHLTVTRSDTNARGEFLSALEAYVASLVSRGRPVPYALRDELRLHRLTCSADRYRR